MNNCPKCGAELQSPNAPHRGWLCGSYTPASFLQSSTCRIRELTAENTKLTNQIETQAKTTNNQTTKFNLNADLIFQAENIIDAFQRLAIHFINLVANQPSDLIITGKCEITKLDTPEKIPENECELTTQLPQSNNQYHQQIMDQIKNQNIQLEIKQNEKGYYIPYKITINNQISYYNYLNTDGQWKITCHKNCAAHVFYNQESTGYFNTYEQAEKLLTQLGLTVKPTEN